MLNENIQKNVTVILIFTLGSKNSQYFIFWEMSQKLYGLHTIFIQHLRRVIYFASKNKPTKPNQTKQNKTKNQQRHSLSKLTSSSLFESLFDMYIPILLELVLQVVLFLQTFEKIEYTK